MGCKIVDCKKNVFRRGWCAMHWQRWRRHGDPMVENQMSSIRTVDEKMDYHLARGIRDSECLIMEGGINSRGYKQIRIDNRLTLLHRLVLERKIGRPLKQDECALHSCHRPNCCEASHLRVGTKLDNSRDMFEAGRANPPKGETHPSARLTEANVMEIRSKWAFGQSFASLGREYGIACKNIRCVVKRQTWKHVA